VAVCRCARMGCTPYTLVQMTIVSTANPATDVAPNTALLAEICDSSSTDVEMMIGIGLVKDSDAVFFQYVGDKATQALTLPSGKPLTRLQNVRVSGISVADNVGEFNSTKLNLYLQTQQGRTIMLTSGLTTIWSQCILTGLMACWENGNLPFAITIDSWKGTSKLKPCFAAIRSGQLKMSDQDMYEQLRDARSDRDNAKVTAICRDAVGVLAQALGNETPVDVQVEQETEF